MPARDIFISYARSDGNRDVALLAEALRCRGISYWLEGLLKVWLTPVRDPQGWPERND